MPHSHTFTIPTVQTILRRFVGNGWGWADPFANARSPAEHTNDINPDMPTKYNMDAVAFLRLFGDGELKGVLLDPPYSMHQIVECYEGYGGKRVKAMRAVYDETARVVKPGGIVISFGWNSNGVGAGRGFNLVEVVLIPHGGSHNDTIVTVEAKAEQTMELFPSVADTQPTLAACARGSRSETAQADNDSSSPTGASHDNRSTEDSKP